MTPRLPLIGGDTIVVSPSQLEVVRTCPAMWKWKHLHRRVKSTPNPAAHGGRAFDEALNLRYRTHGGDPCTPSTEEAMLTLIDKAYEGVELPLEEHRTPARFKEAVVAYNRHWGREAFRVLGVQVPFAVLLGTVTSSLTLEGTVKVVLRGILDLFIQSADHVIIYDTKTSNNDIGSSYENSAQLKGYCWALQELARLHPDQGLPPVVHAAAVNGVILRPDYKPGRTPTARDKPRIEFVRPFPSFYSAERLERWRRDTLAWVQTALGWVANDHFPANERHCTFHMDAAFKNYGTYGQNCPYLGVCTAPESQQEMALATDEFMDYGEGPLGKAGAGEMEDKL